MARRIATPIITLGSLLITQTATAQTAFYVSNPLSGLSKGRVKLEQRINERNSVMVSGAGYWALNPGYQFFAEYRNYKFVRPATERFFYAKTGYGHCQSSNGLGWRHRTPEIPFNYTLGGAGMGYHFYINKAKTVIIDLAGGVKLTLPDVEETDPRHKIVTPPFYIAGPGSIVDLNAHLAIQIGSEKLKNAYKAKKTATKTEDSNDVTD